jgi:uncharacterized protein DUF4864
VSRLLAGLLLALTASCSAGEVAGEAPSRTAVEEAPPEDPHGELACDTQTQAAIDDTIDGQLAAFAAGDYAAALAFSSDRFRSQTTPEQFQQVIETDYAPLIGAAGHRSELCVLQGDTAQLLVTVEGEDGENAELVYRLTFEEGQWRIDVAGPAPESETVPV